MSVFKVSVIVPIYNVEKYIGRCMKSLMEQTLTEIEYIFVDDCSPDNSINIVKQILSEYSERKIASKIISHSENKGVARARQDGLASASGEYVIYCDPDDEVDLNMYKLMYDEAKTYDADVVICDLNEIRNDKIKLIKQSPLVNDGISILKQMSGEALPALIGATWNKLIKLNLAKTAYFKDDINYCEDVLYLFKIMPNASGVAYIDQPLYYYYNRPGSIVRTFNRKFYESDLRLFQELERLKNNSLNPEYQTCCEAFIGTTIGKRIFNYEISPDKLKRDLKPYIPYISKSNNLNFSEKVLIFMVQYGAYRIAKSMYKVMISLKNRLLN